jgi:hypothetical protein
MVIRTDGVIQYEIALKAGKFLLAVPETKPLWQTHRQPDANNEHKRKTRGRQQNMKDQRKTNLVMLSRRARAPLAIWFPVQALMANQMGGTSGGMGGTNGWMGGGMWLWTVVIVGLLVVLLVVVMNKRSKN